jgi:hypothetical protein
MTSMQRYSTILLATAAAAIVCSILLSLHLDPYRIVHPLLGEFSFEPNSRVSKLEFLTRDCRRFDSYFFGDSRAATLSDRDLPDVTGHRFYNFSTPADNVRTIVPRLKFLLDAGCPVTAVVTDASLDVLLDQNQISRYSLLLTESPKLSGESRASFYSRYFLSAQALSGYVSARLRPPATHDIYFSDGHAEYLWSMSDGSSFLLPRCGAPALSAAQKQLLFEMLPAYRELAQMAQQYHFAAIVWIAPLSRSESSLVRDPDVAAFIAQLHAIPKLGIVEPDWNSPMLADYHEWHDCGHFRRSVFDRLIAPSISQLMPKAD